MENEARSENGADVRDRYGKKWRWNTMEQAQVTDRAKSGDGIGVHERYGKKWRQIRLA